MLAEVTDWISAAGDYIESHGSRASSSAAGNNERNGEEAGPGEVSSDPQIAHRAAAIAEPRGIDCHEYIVKLRDGSEHRSSRTYARALENWLNSGKKQKEETGPWKHGPWRVYSPAKRTNPNRCHWPYTKLTWEGLPADTSSAISAAKQ